MTSTVSANFPSSFHRYLNEKRQVNQTNLATITGGSELRLPLHEIETAAALLLLYRFVLSIMTVVDSIRITADEEYMVSSMNESSRQL
eukprot:scaffold2499_cov125-Cylindrotheca_fusiformis.AAC.29